MGLDSGNLRASRPAAAGRSSSPFPRATVREATAPHAARGVQRGEEESVIWFDGEAVYLRDYLRDNGYADAFKDQLNTGRITAVSADGRVLVGHNAGIAGPNRWGFIVVLPGLDAK